MLNGWIIYNGFLPGDKFRDFADMLHEAALERGHKTTIKTNDEIINHLTEKLKDKPDYVLFTDKDIYLANTLERAGIAVFNKAEAIEISDDKIKTYEKLVDAKLPIPKTIVAPKTFGMDMTKQTDFLDSITQEFGFPFIMKEAFGSFGEQVYLVHNQEDLYKYLKKIGGAPFVFQAFLDTSFGQDLRLQVVGDQVVTAMKRTAKDDFRANVTNGGEMKTYIPNEYEKELAIKATKAIQADFAGVDLLFGEGDQRLVCEVNSNGHIRNLLDSTNVNAAPFIIKHIENQLDK